MKAMEVPVYRPTLMEMEAGLEACGLDTEEGRVQQSLGRDHRQAHQVSFLFSPAFLERMGL